MEHTPSVSRQVRRAQQRDAIKRAAGNGPPPSVKRGLPVGITLGDMRRRARRAERGSLERGEVTAEDSSQSFVSRFVAMLGRALGLGGAK